MAEDAARGLEPAARGRPTARASLRRARIAEVREGSAAPLERYLAEGSPRLQHFARDHSESGGAQVARSLNARRLPADREARARGGRGGTEARLTNAMEWAPPVLRPRAIAVAIECLDPATSLVRCASGMWSQLLTRSTASATTYATPASAPSATYGEPSRPCAHSHRHMTMIAAITTCPASAVAWTSIRAQYSSRPSPLETANHVEAVTDSGTRDRRRSSAPTRTRPTPFSADPERDEARDPERSREERQKQRGSSHRPHRTSPLRWSRRSARPSASGSDGTYRPVSIELIVCRDTPAPLPAAPARAPRLTPLANVVVHSSGRLPRVQCVDNHEDERRRSRDSSQIDPATSAADAAATWVSVLRCMTSSSHDKLALLTS